ncbi:hypothetical protein H5T88_00840 [bacterium]|nr:hypothetical protein [bacterium]
MRIFHPIKDPILLTACIIASLLGSFLVLALMHKFLSMRAKGRLITALTFLAGFFYSLEFFLPAKDGKNFLTPWVEPVGDALAVIGAFAFPLGLISLAVVHLGNIRRRREGWYFSLFLFIAMLAMALSAFLNHYARLPLAKNIFTCLFSGLYIPLGVAMMSTLAFYIVSAAYRAFRVTNVEAVLMMGAAIIVMLGQIPFGMWLTSWLPMQGIVASLRIENLSNWFMTVVNMSVQRAIGFGLAIGGIAMALRVWLSLERGMQLGGK